MSNIKKCSKKDKMCWGVH